MSQIPPAGILDLMSNRGVNVAAELAMRWCKRGGKSLGDYLEFGTYRGSSFTAFFRAAQRHDVTDMRFYGFDSFEGLPETPTCPPDEDPTETAFVAGNYSCSEEEFRHIVAFRGVDLSRVTLVPGFFDQSLTEELKVDLAIASAGIVNIDCDLYESTVDVLNFVTSLLRSGSLILFDDWLSYDAHPLRGEQRACREWLEEHPEIHLTEYFKYTRTGVAFIVSMLTPYEQQVMQRDAGARGGVGRDADRSRTAAPMDSEDGDLPAETEPGPPV